MRNMTKTDIDPSGIRRPAQGIMGQVIQFPQKLVANLNPKLIDSMKTSFVNGAKDPSMIEKWMGQKIEGVRHTCKQYRGAEPERISKAIAKDLTLTGQALTASKEGRYTSIQNKDGTTERGCVHDQDELSRIGLWLLLDTKDNVRQTTEFKENMAHGDSCTYDEKGNLESQGSYKNGVQHGTHRHYANNELAYEEIWKEGEMLKTTQEEQTEQRLAMAQSMHMSQ